jgi:hypothetical protein
MSALQAVTLQFPSEPDCLELEQIAAGERVLRAYRLRNKARAQNLSAELVHDTDALLWRRICDLMSGQCSEAQA